MFGLTQPSHIIIILLLALLLFGAKRLPEIGRSLGSGMREFKDSVSSNSHADDTPAEPQQLPPAETTAVAQTTATPSERETV
jgi:sec-independent protein translocase protein TatA